MLLFWYHKYEPPTADFSTCKYYNIMFVHIDWHSSTAPEWVQSSTLSIELIQHWPHEIQYMGQKNHSYFDGAILTGFFQWKYCFWMFVPSLISLNLLIFILKRCHFFASNIYVRVLVVVKHAKNTDLTKILNKIFSVFRSKKQAK